MFIFVASDTAVGLQLTRDFFGAANIVTVDGQVDTVTRLVIDTVTRLLTDTVTRVVVTVDGQVDTGTRLLIRSRY